MDKIQGCGQGGTFSGGVDSGGGALAFGSAVYGGGAAAAVYAGCEGCGFDCSAFCQGVWPVFPAAIGKFEGDDDRVCGCGCADRIYQCPDVAAEAVVVSGA